MPLDRDRRTLFLVVACCLVGGLCGGCGQAAPPGRAVSGNVLLDGEPLTAGRVTFFGTGGEVEATEIRSDGTYLITHAPRGEVRIIVTGLPRATLFRDEPQSTRAPPTGAPALARSELITDPRIPAHYGDPDRSGLRLIVLKGDQTHDLLLTATGKCLHPRAAEDKAGPSPRPGVEVGQVAPNIEGEDLNGAALRLRDYRGKVVLLTFWGHW